MQNDLARLLEAAKATILAPRRVARQIIDLQVPTKIGWMGFVLAIAASTAASAMIARFSPFELEPAMAVVFSKPMLLAALQGTVLLVMLMLIHGVGRMMGGKGQFSDALALMAWLEVVLTLVLVLQLLVLLVSPLLAVVLGMMSFALRMWGMASFVAELHGFASSARVLGAIIATAVLLSFIMRLLAIGAGVNHV